MKSLVLNRWFWPVPAMMVAISLLHYAALLGFDTPISPAPGASFFRLSVDRILFLAPIVYAGYSLRFKVGLATCVIALLIMLPRAIFFTSFRVDSLLEVCGVVVAGVLACFWFEARSTAREQRREATRELETVQETLQTQIRLSRSNAKRLATLNSISGMLSRSLEAGPLLRSALDLVTDVMEVEVALIFTIDKGSLRLAAYEGVSDRFVEDLRRMATEDSYNARVVRDGGPLSTDDASTDPGLARDSVKREKILAELIVPLRAKGLITGTLCVANRRPRRFLPEEIELLTAIGAQIGVALENTNLYRQQQAMVQEYRSIFDNATEAIWLQDLNGNIVKANPAVARLTGYRIDELHGMDQSRFLPVQGQQTGAKPAHSPGLADLAGAPSDQPMIKKDGTEALVRVSSSPMYDDGRLVGFQYIATDVTRERLMQENLRYYIEAITKAQEEERKRIARELHDETAQQLIALSHQLDDFSNHNSLSPDDLEVLETWHRRLKDALQGVRLFSRDLRPPMIDDLGLVPALEWFTGQLNSEGDMAVRLRVSGGQRRLTPEAELLLFRIAQEALNNARRHAEASTVEVSLEFSEQWVTVRISDNGKGFRLPESVGDLSRAGKMGLMGIEERAHLLGARLAIDSQLGRGTTILVEAPV